jgi:hypothetical protein
MRILAVFFLLFSIGGAEAASNRVSRPWGLAASNEVFPSVVGVTASYNYADFGRASVGLGTVFFYSTVGANLIFQVPDWDFTPRAGLMWGYQFGSADMGFLGVWTPGQKHYLGFHVGLEWTAKNGFFLAGGYTFNIPMSTLSGIPSASIGWFF